MASSWPDSPLQAWLGTKGTYTRSFLGGRLPCTSPHSNPIGMLGFLEIHLNKGLCGFHYCEIVIYNKNSLWLSSRFLEQRSSHPWNFLNGEQHGGSWSLQSWHPPFRLRPPERRGVASCQLPGWSSVWQSQDAHVEGHLLRHSLYLLCFSGRI